MRFILFDFNQEKVVLNDFKGRTYRDLRRYKTSYDFMSEH